MSNTVNCLMIDSTQWLTFPSTGFRGPSSAKHWSMVKTFKACSSLSDRSILARVGARCKSTASMIFWSRVKLHRGNDGHDLFLILQRQNHTNMAATYQTSSSCLIFANSVCQGVPSCSGFETYPRNYSSQTLCTQLMEHLYNLVP